MKAWLVSVTTLSLTGCFIVEPPTEDPPDIQCTSAPSGFEEQMLCAHNDVRTSSLSPQPSPALNDLTWSNDLAETAENYAEQCIWAHNPDRGDGYNVQIGENLYAQTSEPTNTAAVESWASEAADYTYASNSCEPGKMCGHYTQVVWRETTEVGCAIHFCSSIDNLPDWQDGGYMVVCNYAPAGNYVGQQPY